MHELLEFLLGQDEQFRRARLASLYSDFTRQKVTNPDGYAANVAVWINGLAKAAKAGLIPECKKNTMLLNTGPVLLQALETREWGQPAALGAVVNEAVRKRELLPLQPFLQANTRVLTSRATSKPWWLITWTLNQLGLGGTGFDKSPQARFIFTKNLKETSKKVASITSWRDNVVEKIMPMSEFEAKVSEVLGIQDGISTEDLEVILTYLSREEGEIAFNERMVKFRGTDGRPPEITAQDRDIASLTTLVLDLGKQCANISLNIENLTEDIKAAVAARNRPAALRLLRSRKTQEALLDRRSESLAQIDGIYDKVKEAANQIELIGALRSGAKVLRGLNAEIGGADTVTLVLQEFGEEMSKTQDVESLIAEGNGRMSSPSDEIEINAELEALELKDKLVDEETQAKEAARVAKELGSLDVPAPVKDEEQPIRMSQRSEGPAHEIGKIVSDVGNT